MIAASDSSPLIILAKLSCFDLLAKAFDRVYISAEVHREVVVAGGGLPGSSEVANATWIEVKQLQNQSGLLAAQRKYPLAAGELSTILVAKEIPAATVLLDDFNARRLATSEGLHVRGSIGLLETFYRAGYLTDLRSAFQQLRSASYVDLRLLNRRLAALKLSPL